MKSIGTEDINCWTYLENVKDEVWKLPDWQRDSVWVKKQKESFFKTVRRIESMGGGELPSCIQIGRIKSKGRFFINDGAQRYYAVLYCLNQLKTDAFYQDETSARNFLKKIKIHVQSFEYESEDEAKEYFSIINNCTTATPWEKVQTILTDVDNYKQIKKEIYDEIHRSVSEAHSRAKIKMTKSRKTYHKHLRDDLALFFRFLTRDTSRTNYHVSSGTIDDDALIDKKSSIIFMERKLVNEINDMDYEDLKSSVGNFKKFLVERSALIDEVWSKVDKTDWYKNSSDNACREAISESCFRFSIATLIFMRNNEINLSTQEEVIGKFLTISKGSASVPDENSRNGGCPLKMSDLSRLKIVERAIDMSLDQFIKIRKQKDSSRTFSGNEVSHIEPVCMFGEGDVVSELAMKNRARGNRSMGKEMTV